MNDYVATKHREKYEFLKLHPKVVKCIKLPEQDVFNDFYDSTQYTIGQLYPVYVDCDDIVFIPQENENKDCFEVNYGISINDQPECFETIR
jgi:hypothetical protein